MKAKFVSESIHFERGKSPKSGMELGVGTKRAITETIEKFEEATNHMVSYMDTSPFWTRNEGHRWAFMVESEMGDIGPKLNEIAEYAGMDMYFDKVFQLNNLGGTPYVRKSGRVYQYIWYLKPEFETPFETALSDYMEI
jgi:hypothetical protein